MKIFYSFVISCLFFVCLILAGSSVRVYAPLATHPEDSVQGVAPRAALMAMTESTLENASHRLSEAIGTLAVAEREAMRSRGGTTARNLRQAEEEYHRVKGQIEEDIRRILTELEHGRRSAESGSGDQARGSSDPTVSSLRYMPAVSGIPREKLLLLSYDLIHAKVVLFGLQNKLSGWEGL